MSVFHPTEPLSLLARESMMGDFFSKANCFNGIGRPISGDYLLAIRRFTEPVTPTRRIVEFLISPLDEEDIEPSQDAFKTFRLVSVSLISLSESRIPDDLLSRPSAEDVEDIEPDFKPMEMYSEERKDFEAKSQKEVQELLGVGGGRGAVLDMLATGSHVVTVKNKPAVERRALNGDLLEVIQNSLSGAQIFALEDGRFLINTTTTNQSTFALKKSTGDCSPGMQRQTGSKPFSKGLTPFLLSQSFDGTILARSCARYSKDTSAVYRQAYGVDFLIDRNLIMKPLAPLGSIDWFGYISTKTQGTLLPRSRNSMGGLPRTSPETRPVCHRF